MKVDEVRLGVTHCLFSLSHNFIFKQGQLGKSLLTIIFHCMITITTPPASFPKMRKRAMWRIMCECHTPAHRGTRYIVLLKGDEYLIPSNLAMNIANISLLTSIPWTKPSL